MGKTACCKTSTASIPAVDAQCTLSNSLCGKWMSSFISSEVYMYTWTIKPNKVRAAEQHKWQKHIKKCLCHFRLEWVYSDALFQNGRNLSILLFTCKLALVASFNDVRAQNFPRTHFFKTLTVGKKWQDKIKNVKNRGSPISFCVTDHGNSRISSHSRWFWPDSLLSAYI